MKIRKKSNHRKASVVLFIAVIGTLLFFPFRNEFWCGLLTAIFIAGVVGGLADWFAVSALFCKPLGIPFRTAIIPRNRQKILRAIAKMVGEDLLAIENVKSHVEKYSIVKFLLYYLSMGNCKKNFITLLLKIIKNLTDVIDTKILIKYIFGTLLKKIKNAESNVIISRMLCWSIEKKYLRKLLSIIAKEVSGVTDKKWFTELLTFVVSEIKKSYEQELENRKLLTLLMEEFGGLSLTSIVGSIKERLNAILYDLQSTETESDVIIVIESKVKLFAERLLYDDEIINRINDYIYVWLKNNEPQLNGLLLSKVEVYMEKIKNIEYNEQAYLYLSKKYDEFIVYVQNSVKIQEKIDEGFKIFILEIINRYHKKIGQLIYARLDNFTDKMLVDFIEEKVGNDLQMIRINGTVVGGAVGAVTYLLGCLFI